MGNSYPLSDDAFEILLRQKNRIARTSLFSAGRSTERFRSYSMGLLSRHRKGMLSEIARVCSLYPWSLRRGALELCESLISCVQSEMILGAARSLREKRRFPAFIPVSFYADETSIVIVFECFMDFFEHFGFITRLRAAHYSKEFYSSMESSSLVLRDFVAADERFEISNRSLDSLCVKVADETADIWVRTDSFLGKGGVLWKRISCCMKNG
jgi:hypothetical protein